MNLGIVFNSRFYSCNSGYYTHSNIQKEYFLELTKYWDKISFVPFPAYEGYIGFRKKRSNIKSTINSYLPQIDIINTRGPRLIPNYVTQHFSRQIPIFQRS